VEESKGFAGMLTNNGLTPLTGIEVLKQCDRIARKQIIFFTPLGMMPQEYEEGDQDGWGQHGGSWQTHRSGWDPAEFPTDWLFLVSKDFHQVNGKGEAFDPPYGAFIGIRTVEPNKNAQSADKVAIVSHILPPSPSGQAVMLGRLLRSFSPDQYCLLSLENYDPHRMTQFDPSRLPGPYFHLASRSQAAMSLTQNRLLRKWRSLTRQLLDLRDRSQSIQTIAKQQHCRSLVACSGDTLDIPATALAARMLGIPFYAYMFDDYRMQWKAASRKTQWFTAVAEWITAKLATGFIVPNEHLRDEYRHRYGNEPLIIRNPIDDRWLEITPSTVWPTQRDEIRIVYTGAIYHAHYDAIRNLIAAINSLGRTDVKLHLYTAQPKAELDREQITGPVVVHDHVPPTQLIDIQANADILFLPLAFNSPIQSVIRTSAPGKLGEYLAAGRPVLAHVPADSFVCWYIRQHDAGWVVDQPDPDQLAKAIRSIIADESLRQKRTTAARKIALTDFDPNKARRQFAELIA
jgi:glycosyltransferase involved in cell wall biosynthesis